MTNRVPDAVVELPTCCVPHRFGSSHLSDTPYEKAPRRGALSCGAPGEIRTPDPLVRSQMLYPTELRARDEQIVSNSGGACRRDYSAHPCAPPSWGHRIDASAPIRCSKSFPTILSNSRPSGSKIDGLGETQFSAKRKYLIFNQSLAGRPLQKSIASVSLCGQSPAKVPQSNA